jgi:DNA-binding transcriptional LysR family regulator
MAIASLSRNAAGDAILRQCMAMEYAALDLERVAAGRDSLVTGSVRVTTTEALAYPLVAPAIAALRQAHPELRVDLIVGVRSLDIARRDADLAVRFARPSASDLSVADSARSASRSMRHKGIWPDRYRSEVREWPATT